MGVHRARGAAWLLASIVAAAAGAEPGTAPEPAGRPGLDTLLKLPPSSAVAESPRSGGASRHEWEQRFATARGDVAAAQLALEKAQADIGRAADGSNPWQMSAPGAQAGTENSPVSFRLRQEIRRQREELASAQKRLSELEVEAKLAGVPDEWIHPPSTTPSEPPPPDPTQDASQ
jgi:hypothetical protein